MSSFLQRSAQKKSEAGGNVFGVDSPLRSSLNRQNQQTATFATRGTGNQNVFGLYGVGARQASNVSPHKKSTIEIQQHSPVHSFLQSSIAQPRLTENQPNRTPLQLNLDSLSREIRDLSFEKHFLNKINNSGPVVPPKQAKQQANQRSKGVSMSNSRPMGYSPSPNQHKLFSPNRLLSRLSSPNNTKFQDFDKTPSQITSSQNLQNVPAFQRSTTSLQGGLQQLLNETRSKIQRNSLLTNPLNTRVSQQSSQGEGSFLNVTTSQTAVIIDKRARDLEDYLMTLTSADFNTLPSNNVEHLLKLSSVIMTKVKNSNFYRTTIF